MEHRSDRKVLKRKTKVQTYKTMSYRMKEGRTREKSEEDIQKEWLMTYTIPSVLALFGRL